jgi:hypothetical protein
MLLHRREVLRLFSAAGLAATGLGAFRRATAESEAAPGTCWLFVHAAGGWDPTLLCDPKGRATDAEPDPVNTYRTSDILDIGPFRVAPIDGHAAFFERFQDNLLVINGVDAQTNSHEVGTRHTWSGTMTPGAPALAALIAASSPSPPPLALLSNGGYDVTDGLVAPTRLPSTSTVMAMAYPDRVSESDPNSALFSDATLQRIAQARADRLERLRTEATLPRRAALLGQLQVARSDDGALAALAAVLPTTLDTSTNPLKKQAQVAMACFKAGVSVSATLEIGGFDTHGDHDRTHTTAMQALLAGVTFAMDEAERQGIADRVVVVIGSDFARTPWYNEGNGKDHWSITSMMAMGPGIPGGRVLGATDDRQSPLLLDPSTLLPDAGGIRLTAGDVHASLRALAGVQTSTAAAAWPVGDDLGLLEA